MSHFTLLPTNMCLQAPKRSPRYVRGDARPPSCT
jgi:hypothetical protein